VKGNYQSLSKKSATVGIFLVELFKRLEDNNIPYCIMRGFEELPEKVEHDIDLQIKKNKSKLYLEVLNSVVNDLGWIILRKRFRFGRRFNSLVYFRNDKFEKIPIDAELSTHWKGIQYISNKTVLDTRKRINGLWVASAGCEAAISLFKDLLQNGKVKDLGDGKHKKRIAQLVREDSHNFIATTEPFFGNKISEYALQCAQSENWESLEKEINKIRKTLIIRAVKRRPLGQSMDWLRYLWGHFSDRILNPSGLFLCLMGPDGSGKTTISLLLRERMEGVFASVLYFHGRLGILPDLKIFHNFFAILFGKTNKIKSRPIENRLVENITPYGISRAMMYLIYYSLDYFLGHCKIKRAKGVGKFILFDRYYYDYFIQQTHLNIPHWILRCFYVFIPKPNLVILLDNDPEVIHMRKPELSIELIKGQIMKSEKLIASLPTGVKIKTDKEPDFVLNRVTEMIISVMIKNQQRK